MNIKKEDVKEKEVIDLTDEPEKRLERSSNIASMLSEKNVEPPKQLEYEGAIEDFLDVDRPPRADLLDSTQEDEPVENLILAQLPDDNDSDSEGSMGSLRLSMSPSLFNQLDEEPPSLLRKPKKSLAGTLDAFYRRWSWLSSLSFLSLMINSLICSLFVICTLLLPPLTFLLQISQKFDEFSFSKSMFYT